MCVFFTCSGGALDSYVQPEAYFFLSVSLAVLALIGNLLTNWRKRNGDFLTTQLHSVPSLIISTYLHVLLLWDYMTCNGTFFVTGISHSSLLKNGRN